MKFLLYCVLLLASLGAKGQSSGTIILSTTLNETRMGSYTLNDFTVFVEFDPLAEQIERTGKEYLKYANSTLVREDALAWYVHSGKRYENVAEQLKKASNGFDLHHVVLYLGEDVVDETLINSDLIESHVRHMVKEGKAVVYYKQERVQTLQYTFSHEGTGLDHGTRFQVYYKDKEQLLYDHYQHLGW
jgi:hypothetical protein